MEEFITDKEFCKAMKIDRATSLRWRDQGLIGYLKLPNGQIRYRQRHIDEFNERTERLAALKDSESAVEGSVVDIRVSKRSGQIGVA